MSKVLLVDVADVELIYSTAIAVKMDDPVGVAELVGIIQGSLGKFFVEAKTNHEPKQS